MTGFDEAVSIVAGAAVPLGSETVALDQAATRVLAAPVAARLDSPRSDVSAMDGYAVRESDLASLPTRLEVVAESFAGHGFGGTIGSGQCVRIFTGAPVPDGADRVVIQEDVRRDDDFALFDTPLGTDRHVRRAGSDFHAGDILLERGRLLDPCALVAAAAADAAEVTVAIRPRVQILATGDELAAPGTAAETDGRIPESVSLGIAALAEQWGALVTGCRRLRDRLGSLHRAAEAAIASADVVVVTGGASVGERDLAKAMFEPLGLELLFSKVAMKPGKPVWFGRCGHPLVIGLPGNPTSALVTGRLLLAPLLAALAGRSIRDALKWRQSPLACGLPRCGARETFHRARWAGRAVQLLQSQDSGAQKALAEADLLVRQPVNGPALGAGELVDVLDF